MSYETSNVEITTGFFEGEDHWGDEVNMAMLLFSSLVQAGALGRTAQADLPDSAFYGDVYIITDGANINKVAIYQQTGGWLYVQPKIGWRIYDRDTDELLIFRAGTAWTAFEPGTGGGGGDASYPPFVGNAGKHLAVNGDEDGVEWVTPESGGGGGGDGEATAGSDYFLDRTIALNGIGEFVVEDLDYANYNYDFEIEVTRAIPGANSTVALRVYPGDDASPPVYYGNQAVFAGGYGATGASGMDGSARIGYLGNTDTKPMIVSLRARFSDDGKSMMGHYSSAMWEYGGTIDTGPVSGVIGTLRFAWTDDVWTGHCRIYKIAKNSASGSGGTLAPSWRYGDGEKRGTIGVTTVGSVSGDPTAPLACYPVNSFFFNGGSAAKEVHFDFGASNKLQGIGAWQDVGDANGTWAIEGSDDDATWTTLIADYQLGGAKYSPRGNVFFGNGYIREFDNGTAYRYYRMRLVAGNTSGNPYVTQFQFKCEPLG